MAIYRMSVQNISRSSGRSSVAASAYRTAERMTDHRQGLEHDYSKRGGVLHTEILLPENAPDWMNNRTDLWNAVEDIEKRKDARLCREILVSLPHELSDKGRSDLVRSFVQSEFVDRGMVADIAIHAPGGEGDNRNHHAHVMLTTRSIEGDGFGGKDRSWNDKALLEEWRVGWEQHANHALEREGVEDRIDHRSLKARHIEQVELKDAALERGDLDAAQEHEINAMSFDREPLPHIGFRAWAMEHRGIQTAIGAGFREAKDRLEQVREVVNGLRDGMSRVLERSGLSQAYERFLRSSEAPELEHVPQEKPEQKTSLEIAMEKLQSSTEERKPLAVGRKEGIEGMLERLDEAPRASMEEAQRNVAVETAAREAKEHEEQQAREAAERLVLEQERERVRVLELERVRELKRGHSHSM
jgi:ATP-dependent exoDNAse (exonuclease V) alpha subunit